MTQNTPLITIDYQSPEDAWLTGITRAISAVITNGIPLTAEEFTKRYKEGWREVELAINIGRDEDHGIWHIVGYRMGIYLVLLTQWDIAQINTDEGVAELWASIMDDDPEVVAATVADPLHHELGVDIVMMGPAESRFFRRYCS